MKKILLSSLFAAFIACTVCAQDAQTTQNSEPWDFISFTLVPGIPPSADVNNVYGVKVGLPIGFSEKTFVSGVEASVIASTTPYVYGVQTAILYNQAKTVEGLQASFIYNEAKDAKGLQFSIVNYAEDSAFQIGIVNIIKNSPLPFLPFINIKL